MDSYVYIITALLPLAASMLVFQTNPYHALVIRGVLGAISALVYAILGAADVALTEALVGTLLAITLYAVAVRSSLVLRLGVLKDDFLAIEQDADQDHTNHLKQKLANLRVLFEKYHLRVELVPYLDHADLHHALINKEVHVIYTQSDAKAGYTGDSFYLNTRLQRIHEILNADPSLTSVLVDINALNPKEVCL
ncbi:MAG TPA: DUF4040 domain-containing protein [Leptolyngbyaceae cyanobacterium M33_DOE_097]|uniref:DUF4040 domain-containing protein n=1 Tax=Oscillatoriales cyanobacterium SpSt-418 TaxID=2282169 RepID=A0A7C3PGK0_9CYAN|nr:DUF4040 domain-containing protein [Leptolyngbyaceae cyanobacterium M33_DOE_097]